MNDCIAFLHKVAIQVQISSDSAELSLEPGAEAGHSGVDGRHPGLPAPRVTKGGHPHEDTDPGLGDEAAPGVALTPIPTSAMQPSAQVSR